MRTSGASATQCGYRILNENAVLFFRLNKKVTVFSSGNRDSCLMVIPLFFQLSSEGMNKFTQRLPSRPVS